MAIPQTFIQELLNHVDVVGRYVQLKKGGANLMRLCPLHGEKSPSFSVSPAKHLYHCFGCGANGFLMKRVGVRNTSASAQARRGREPQCTTRHPTRSRCVLRQLSDHRGDQAHGTLKPA